MYEVMQLLGVALRAGACGAYSRWWICEWDGKKARSPWTSFPKTGDKFNKISAAQNRTITIGLCCLAPPT
jgi:hypothetical protein